VTGRPGGGALDAIARFAGSRTAILLVSGWAAAEAVFLPIVPDVALVLLALAAPRRAAVLFLAALVGAVAGSIVLAFLAASAPDAADSLLRSIPGIDEARIAAAAGGLEDGVAGFAQFGPGPPLKVYTVSWTESGGGILGLVVGVVLNRLTRIAPAVLAAAVVGWLIPGWLRRHERMVLGGYALAWLVLYAAYLS
jgi:hypothetical protein